MFTILILLGGLVVGGVAPTDEVRLINNILENKTEKHWVQDRASDKNMISCAATGVGFYAFARASQLGVISKETALAWIKDGFRSMIDVNFENDGWLYHFIDRSGRAYKDSEVSSIDSIIFYLGAERAAELLEDKELLIYIRSFKEKISIAVMLDGEDGYFYHGWIMEDGKRKILRSKWRSYNEGVLIYKYFDRTFKPINIDYSLPMFVFYYPLAFYPGENQWKEHLGRAIDFQIDQTGRCGYSAMDTQSGYQVNSPYFVSPLAIYSCRNFFPLKIQPQLDRLRLDPLTQSVSVNGKWRSADRVLLDDGFAIMLIGDQK